MGLAKARTCKENVHKKKIPSTGNTSFKRKERRERHLYDMNNISMCKIKDTVTE